jgi:ribosomal protein S18 acetylase RimI-like enzyme
VLRLEAIEMKNSEELQYRFATDTDLPLLAEWNLHLIQDEGHRNPMKQPELEQRMCDWLKQEYQAVLFTWQGEDVAYALFREDMDSIYLRQLYVDRPYRRAGIGSQAVDVLRSHIWPHGATVVVEALCNNTAACAFWRSLGFKDYSLTLEWGP